MKLFESACEDLIRTNREFRHIIENLDSHNEYDVITNFSSTLKKKEETLREMLINNKEKIKEMYDYIKDWNDKRKIINNASDTKFLVQSYMDYFSGMNSFLKEIIQGLQNKSLTEEEKIEILKKLETVKERDEVYLSSIDEKKDMRLDEAIYNIECIKNIILSIDNFQQTFDELNYEEIHDKDIRLMIVSIMSNSIMNFLSYIENCFFDTVNGFENIMHPEKKNDRPMVATDNETFVIF